MVRVRHVCFYMTYLSRDSLHFTLERGEEDSGYDVNRHICLHDMVRYKPYY